MDRSRVSLVSFHAHLLPAARKAGYKVVIAALAREADSPSFFADVKRYWSSLHDVTGPDVLFVFAGANAANELHEHGIPSKGRELNIDYYTDNMAVRSQKDLYWGASLDSQNYETLPFGQPTLKPDEDFSTDHTLELNHLRRFLGISEEQIPCLLFTLLSPRLSVGPNDVIPHIVVPFTVFSTQTVYVYLKNLVSKWEQFFKIINAADSERRALELRRPHIDQPLLRLSHDRRSVKCSLAELKGQPAIDAIYQILQLTGMQSRDDTHLTECYRLFRIVKADHPQQSGIITALQRLIGVSFLPNMRRYYVQGDAYSTGSRAIEEETRVWQLEESAHEAWNSLRSILESSVKAKQQPTDNWGFFIAYSSSDRGIAEQMYLELSKIGRSFLDARCLLPGDRWPERLRRAQDNSKSTVVLITELTPGSWYTESEYLHAIELRKRGSHRIIPILYGADCELPYGLEQVQSLRIDSAYELEYISERLRHVL